MNTTSNYYLWVGGFIAFLMISSMTIQAQQYSAIVDYTVSLPEPQTQMVEISMHIPEVDADSLELHLPTWRPGKYLILDTSGTLQEMRAFNATNTSLLIEKSGKSSWEIKTEGSRDIRVEYKIYANSITDRTRHVDDTHAFLSGSSIFLYEKKRRHSPLEVKIEAPQGWRISSGLAFHPSNKNTLIAPDYDVLVDSPIEIGVHDLIRFEVQGTPHEIMIWGAPRYDESKLIQDFKKIIEKQIEIWGRIPYERYVFMIHAADGLRGGTEHLNSTIMQTSYGTLDDPKLYDRFLGLVSHEFFHTWNVKQLRPDGLLPYDYQKENYTKLLWVCEGTTSYYTDLVLARSGLKTETQYLESLSKLLNRYFENEGRKLQSLEESSFDSWIKFSRPNPHSPNTTVSFYSQGAIVSMILDLEIRKQTSNQASLDVVLRNLFEQFPLSGEGFSPTDFQSAVEKISGSSFSQFFQDYVSGVKQIDFDLWLNLVGLQLERKTETKEDSGKTNENLPEETESFKAFLGLSLNGNTVSSVKSNGPAFLAGLASGDEILAIDQRRLRPSNLEDHLKKYTPGDLMQITFFRRSKLKELKIRLGRKPNGSLKVTRVSNPTDAQKKAYKSWIQQPWPKEKQTQKL